MRYIGDVHHKFPQYLEIVKDCDESVQVGDFGAGFKELPMMRPSDRFIRGNHDNLAVCRESPNWIPDGTFQNGVFYTGGAFSIDRKLGLVGVDWWDDEELPSEEAYAMVNHYEEVKPEIVVTHDCPRELGIYIFGRGSEKAGRNRTNMCLQTMFEIHRPKVWIFGHWHTDARKTILGTEFICLAELSWIDL